MAELIKYRNDAAHGSIDIGNILSVNGLIEFCDFVAAVCEALAERIQLAGLTTLKAQGHVREQGRVTESLRDGLIAVADDGEGWVVAADTEFDEGGLPGILGAV